jgi:periplasmic protein TonB
MAYANVQPKKLSPAGLTAAIAINGAVFGALLLAAPTIVKVYDQPIEIYDVKQPEPPPLPPEQPKPQPERATEAPLRHDPIVKTPPLPTFLDIKLSDDPVLTFDPDPGSAEPVVEPTVTPRAPVITNAEIDPRYMRDFQPSYPPSKIRLEEEGRVTVRILVGANGRVLQVQAVGNPDADFLAATRKQALSKWRFKPATRDGVPTEAWREISVRFELNS